MDKENLLKTIAETGYNVGFGAKKNFATYDIIQKAPGFIGFIAIAAGIFSLVFDSLATKIPSATLAVLGVVGLYISLRDHRKKEYELAGKQLTQLFNRLRDLCRSIEGGADISHGLTELRQIENEYYNVSVSEQILLSDWYAHYKFFAQQQTDWIAKHRPFTWRDKIPLSARFAGMTLFVVGCVGLLCLCWMHWRELQHFVN
jgi:hypothetical protein